VTRFARIGALTVAIVGLAIAGRIALGGANPITWYAESADYLRHPAETSPSSRWYSLTELGLSESAAVQEFESASPPTDRNSGMVDLSDFACPPRLQQLWDREVLARSEPWEGGIETGKDVIGYPSVVQNVHGKSPDGKFYLFYAIHDPYAGIALAVGDTIDGPFRKLKDISVFRADSRVLRAPKRPRKTSHFSSPVVQWNPQENAWFLYFHFYANEWDAGGGHQRTTLAVTDSLSSHSWKPWTDAKGRLISVLPTTHERWMNSQSTYHGIYRLRNGRWIAFLRGVGGEYDAKGVWQQDVGRLGFAISPDGRRWAELGKNPVIYGGDGRNSRKGVYRPFFMARLADSFLLGWGESEYYDADPQLTMGTSSDLRQLTPAAAPEPTLPPGDGTISLWRSGDVLYAFYGARQRAWKLVDQCAAPAAARQEK